MEIAPTPYEKGFALGKKNGSLDHNRGKPAPHAASVPTEYLSNTPRGKASDGWSHEAHDYVSGFHDGWKSISGH
ncbi:hypothetical protein L3Y21_gp100 [Gordonia phage Rabbitrun]|uniref:Uncharacterized protein n=1 Tax=Gordonia phage Rabbitrun TaxID=2762280 RepID=A0A7G8LIU4_9CAUD|nr:hypothetical protein L3Y21_gp100 [Gordonia phage Rabbitrun]QNJ57166.1 hypothetical protein SEA_RABBITRUN_136 [Gordonia phage Rabbitrun]